MRPISTRKNAPSVSISSTSNRLEGSSLQHRFGVCQWFHYEDFASVEASVELLQELGIRHLRTGISWADYFRSGGPAWYDWQMNALRDFDVLLSVWHTPPSISLGNSCNSPPKELKAYADFIDTIIGRYGCRIDCLELWNEPNNRYKWDYIAYDPDWAKFSEMIGMAAYWAKKCGMRTVLGGMIPVDSAWLEKLATRGALESIDVVAIHGFPEMWWTHSPNWDWFTTWNGWDQKISSLRETTADRPIWITETGLATWDLDASKPDKFDLQCRMLDDVINSHAERIYWYSLQDLAPYREAIEGFHVDENEYHMGLVTYHGARKPAFHRLKRLLKTQCSKEQFSKKR